MSAAPERLRAIYLNDHLAQLVLARELARRLEGGTPDPNARELAAAAKGEAAQAVRELRRLLERSGARENRAKQVLAWAGERAGRLKLNGAVRSRSPLTGVVELEALAALLEGQRALWRALGSSGDGLEPARGSFASRASRAEELLGRCRELQAHAAATAFRGAGAGPRQPHLMR